MMRMRRDEAAVNVLARHRPLTRNEMAARVARDIPEGWYVNLGIGAPLQVADHVPAEREVIFHSENGVLGMGPAPAPDRASLEERLFLLCTNDASG